MAAVSGISSIVRYPELTSPAMTERDMVSELAKRHLALPTQRSTLEAWRLFQLNHPTLYHDIENRCEKMANDVYGVASGVCIGVIMVGGTATLIATTGYGSILTVPILIPMSFLLGYAVALPCIPLVYHSSKAYLILSSKEFEALRHPDNKRRLEVLLNEYLDIFGKILRSDPELRDCICPLTGALIVDPVLAPDGKTYSRHAIEFHLDYMDKQLNKATSPEEMDEAIRNRSPFAITDLREVTEVTLPPDFLLGGPSQVEFTKESLTPNNKIMALLLRKYADLITYFECAIEGIALPSHLAAIPNFGSIGKDRKKIMLQIVEEIKVMRESILQKHLARQKALRNSILREQMEGNVSSVQARVLSHAVLTDFVKPLLGQRDIDEF